MKKNFVWNTIGVFTNSFTSLFYLVILTQLSTLKNAGIFSFAFAIASVAVTIAGFGGRTYQVTDVKNEISPCSYIISRYFTVFVTTLFLIGFLIFNHYDSFAILLIVCLFKFVEELSDVYFGVIQKENKIYIVGISMFIKAIINVLLFFIAIYIFKSLLLGVILILISNLFFLIFVDRYNAKKIGNYEFKVNKEQVIIYIKRNIPICLFTFLTTYLMNASKYAIEKFLISDYQAIFNIIVMPATVMVLVGGFILNPILVDISKMYNEKKNKELLKLLSRIIALVIAFGTLAAIGASILGIPVLNFIYGIKLDKYKIDLLVIILAATILTVTVILSNILIVMRKTVSQLVMATILAVFAYFISDLFVKRYGITGGVNSYLIIMVLRLLIYIVLFTVVLKQIKRQSKKELRGVK